MIIEDLLDAQILVELRRRLSYAEAARQLKLPPATLSRRVTQMEERAGVLLFERSTRAVSITSAGELAADRAHRMLDEAIAADHAVESLRDAPTGKVRVSVPVILGQAVLGAVAAEYLSLYPDCQLKLELVDQHIGLIEDGFDVAIRVGPIGDEGLVAKPLGLAIASLYQRTAARITPRTIDDLQNCDIGLLHPGAALKPQFALVDEAGEPQAIDVSPRMICLNPWLLMDLALASDTVVVLPDIVARQRVQVGDLQRVLAGFHARRTPIQLAFSSRRLMRPAVRAFIDLTVRLVPTALKQHIDGS